MESKSEIIGALTDMEDLLRQTGQSRRAEQIGKLVQTLESDPEATTETLLGNEFWGGSGSYFDLRLLTPKTRSEAEMEAYKSVNRKYCAMLLRLLNALGAAGYSRPDFALIARFLNENS